MKEIVENIRYYELEKKDISKFTIGCYVFGSKVTRGPFFWDTTDKRTPWPKEEVSRIEFITEDDIRISVPAKVIAAKILEENKVEYGEITSVTTSTNGKSLHVTIIGTIV